MKSSTWNAVRWFLACVLAALPWLLVAFLLAPDPADAQTFFHTAYDGVAFPCDGRVHGVGYDWPGSAMPPVGYRVEDITIILDTPAGVIQVDWWMQSNTASPFLVYFDAHVGPEAAARRTVPLWPKKSVITAQDSYLYAVCAVQPGTYPVIGLSVYFYLSLP